MNGLIIHINGWPGAGKKTIGAILARRLKARFIHNHLLHDIAIVCGGGLNTAERWELYEQVRAAAYGMLARRPRDELFVMTNALTTQAPREIIAWNHVVQLAIDREVALFPVILEVDANENERRVQSNERIGRKLSDPSVLRTMVAEHTLQYPDVAETIAVNVTMLDPDAAASYLETEIHRRLPGLKPASLDHLSIR